MSSDQTYLETLRATRAKIAQGGLTSAAEQMRSLGFVSLKELSDEIERMEDRLGIVPSTAVGATRRITQPIRRVNT